MGDLHQSAVLFSQNKPAISNQQQCFSLKTNQHQSSITSQPNADAVFFSGLTSHERGIKKARRGPTNRQPVRLAGG
jgi:hypothetical protein